MKPIALRTLDNKERVLGNGDSSVSFLVFVFSTTCPYCESNWQTWENLSSLCDGRRVRSIGVSVHPQKETGAFLERRKTSLEVCVGDSTFARTYKVSAVPTTVLLRGDGRVEGVWKGVLKGDPLQEIVARLASHAEKDRRGVATAIHNH